jgi:hypothetical protein
MLEKLAWDKHPSIFRKFINLGRKKFSYLCNSILKLSCRIFEHFATKLDPVTEFIKLRSAIIFKRFATNPDPLIEFIKLESALPSKTPLWRQN